MAAVLTETETREQEAPWLSKVDDRGQTHVYRKTTAGDLKVGDHILEHIVGHKRQVATPILGIQHAADGVIVTIPDRHADNAPVDELYAFNQPVFISRTPHLEQHNPNENIFFQLERKEQDMEQQPLGKAVEGIESAHKRINNAVENLILTVNPGLAAEAAQHVQAGAADLSSSIILGADAVAEAYVKDAFEFGQWNTRLTESALFTQVRSARLETYEQAVSNVELQTSAAYARGALDTATQVALEQRKRGIVASLSGPLAEHALADAGRVGLLSGPKPEEVGVWLAKVPPEAVLGRADGSLVAVPVPPDFEAETGKPVRMVADEIGVYHVMEKEKVMEKQTEVKKEYPRMEAHLKSPDNTWHSVSLYVDKEGQPRGVLSVENREQGLAEKHSVTFTEKVSEKTGEKFLTAKAEREDGTTLYANLTPHEKNGERWLSASFAERDPSREKGQQLSPITGTGGTLKPNAALLEKAEKDRTAQYVRETFKVDPAKEVGKSKGVSR
ncbi:hypothetical protein HF290_03060 [Acidithiobacillus ferrooxidans]|uniref:hypothetical protein n=1 Tax=Acidithiobacillus ferrooxidans TaxID=920 RepID=UPI001C06EA08|nr:hypothetical protein [Acidithiobacillus ferrooxidans]MBU2859427.1 hypothetical protein [Acidithiobacillus ferrooxidans]